MTDRNEFLQKINQAGLYQPQSYTAVSGEKITNSYTDDEKIINFKAGFLSLEERGINTDITKEYVRGLLEHSKEQHADDRVKILQATLEHMEKNNLQTLDKKQHPKVEKAIAEAITARLAFIGEDGKIVPSPSQPTDSYIIADKEKLSPITSEITPAAVKKLDHILALQDMHLQTNKATLEIKLQEVNNVAPRDFRIPNVEKLNTSYELALAPYRKQDGTFDQAEFEKLYKQVNNVVEMDEVRADMRRVARLGIPEMESKIDEVARRVYKDGYKDNNPAELSSIVKKFAFILDPDGDGKVNDYPDEYKGVSFGNSDLNGTVSGMVHRAVQEFRAAIQNYDNNTVSPTPSSPPVPPSTYKAR